MDLVFDENSQWHLHYRDKDFPELKFVNFSKLTLLHGGEGSDVKATFHLRLTGSIAGGSFQIHFSPKPLKI